VQASPAQEWRLRIRQPAPIRFRPHVKPILRRLTPLAPQCECESPLDWNNKHPAVVDLSGARLTYNGLNRAPHPTIGDDHFKLQLWKKIAEYSPPLQMEV
jgi:hypothetical protein